MACNFGHFLVRLRRIRPRIAEGVLVRSSPPRCVPRLATCCIRQSGFVKELRFVYAYYVRVRTSRVILAEESTGVEGSFSVRTPRLVRHSVSMDTGIFLRLAGELGLFQSSDQFFGLCQEHGTADDFIRPLRIISRFVRLSDSCGFLIIISAK